MANPSDFSMTVAISGAQGSIFAERDLLLAGFNATEGMSQLFRFEGLLHSNDNIPFEKLLGQQFLIRLKQGSKKPRCFHGICNNVSQQLRDGRMVYRVVIVPKFWYLTRTVRSRVFDHETVIAILKRVLKEGGLSEGVDFVNHVKDTKEEAYFPHDHCVQYRESDFDFLNRILEEEGIYYFFTHSEQGHQMVFADTNTEKILPATPDVTFNPGRSQSIADVNRIFDWEKGQQLRSTQFTVRDHHFEKNNPITEHSLKGVDSVTVGSVKHKLDHLAIGKPGEMYEYPNDFAHRFDAADLGGNDDAKRLEGMPKDMEELAKIRIQQEILQGLLVSGSGNCWWFSAGTRFKLTKDANLKSAYPNADGAYMVVGVSHAITQGPAGGFAYQNGFSCIPYSPTYPYHPPRATPRPFIPGTQTATVIGDKQEEIFTDRFGRVKVRFHWDRDKKNSPAQHSCWVRVAQVWAGKTWGAFFWPRVGQEVVVAFLEGNPDQPIIIGSVYNEVQPTPYLGSAARPSPDSKHPNDPKVSGIKTSTTPGGVGFNELRFDDTKDKQQVFVHAERNMDVRVKNDSMERVIANRHLIVGWEKDGKKGGDQHEMVYQDKHLNVKRDHIEQIEGNMQLTVGKGQADNGGNVEILIEKSKKELIEEASHLHIKKTLSILVDTNLSQAVGGDQAESVAGKAHLQVQGDRNEEVGGDQSLVIGGSQHERVGKDHALEAGKAIHLRAGMTLVIEAGSQISLKGPGGFIDIGPSGVSISGTTVMINSGGAAASGSGPSPKSPATPVKPEDAKQAKPTQPVVADNAVSGAKSAPG